MGWCIFHNIYYIGNKPVLKSGKTSLENNIKAIKQRLEEAKSLKYEADRVLKELKDNQKNV